MGTFGNSGFSPADLAAVLRGNGNNDGFGGNNIWWAILWIMMMMCGGWNNGGWNNGGQAPAQYVAADVQRGFDQQATTSQISQLQTQVGQGFADNAVAQCQGNANITAAITNGQFGITQAIGNAKDTIALGLNQMAMTNQQGFNDNKAGQADLKYTIATEACADRQAISNGLRDLMAQNTANTNAITQIINNGVQSIRNDLCDDRLAAKDAQIQSLQNQLNMATLSSSQVSQTSDLKEFAAQLVQQAVNSCCPKAVPSYTVPNPNCGCGGIYGGCA